MKNIILKENSSEKNLILYKSVETKSRSIKIFVLSDKNDTSIRSSDIFLGGAVGEQ